MREVADIVRPHLSTTAEGEIVFEWWKETRKLTLYFGGDTPEYIKVWGSDMENEMEVGGLDHWSFIQAWQWLHDNTKNSA